MTAEQKEKFKLYGCVPRCVAELAARKGSPISWDEFCTRFDPHFSNTTDKYGLLNIGALPPILRALSLPDRIASETNFAAVETAINQQSKIALVVSRVDLNQGATGENNHCSVLHSISTTTFTLWTPSQCGSDIVLPPFNVSDWGAKGCTAIILS